MARQNLKAFISYVLFVGLPVLSLNGILRLGRGLVAPISVSGLWKATIHVDQSSCMSEIAPLQENSISIVQSGRRLVVTIGKGITSAGAIVGDEVSGTLIVPAALTQKRSSDYSFVINARIDSHAQPRTLDGTISPAQNASCVPVRFHAVRQL